MKPVAFTFFVLLGVFLLCFSPDWFLTGQPLVGVAYAIAGLAELGVAFLVWRRRND